MHTFCQIIHKSTSDTEHLYNFSTKHNKNKCTHITVPTSFSENNKFPISNGEITKKEMHMEFNNIAWTYEYKPDISLDVTDDITQRLIKTFFHMYSVGPIEYSVSSKFSYFKKTIDNIFMNNKMRDIFIDKFSKIQRHYWVLNRAIRNYKLRKAPFLIRNDLILNPIRESQHNVITILQNNNKYLFTVLDLKSIIESALINSPYFFSEPICPKNPYNNIPFDKSTLYNIYFFMKTGNFVLSTLFHNYFLCNFNLKQFLDENEVLIRKKYIEQYIKNAEYTDLCIDTMRMISLNTYTKKLRIDIDFPMKRLVNIMRPYLMLYFKFLYSLDISERNISREELHNKLKQFYQFNPKFGRRFIKLSKDSQNTVEFNDTCIKFSQKKYNGNYERTHLDLDDDDDDSDNNNYANNEFVNISDHIPNFISAHEENAPSTESEPSDEEMDIEDEDLEDGEITE